MKKSLLAFALLASAATTSFAHDGDKPTKGKKDNCTGVAAAQCTKGMASGNMAGMPACCRAKMSAAKAASPATATTKVPVVKSM